MQRPTCLLLLLGILLLAVSASAATYYAATNGSGSTCSSDAPCTLNTGLGRLGSGDTLLMRDGTYFQHINNDIQETTQLLADAYEVQGRQFVRLQAFALTLLGLALLGIGFLLWHGMRYSQDHGLLLESVRQTQQALTLQTEALRQLLHDRHPSP